MHHLSLEHNPAVNKTYQDICKLTILTRTADGDFVCFVLEDNLTTKFSIFTSIELFNILSMKENDQLLFQLESTSIQAEDFIIDFGEDFQIYCNIDDLSYTVFMNVKDERYLDNIDDRSWYTISKNTGIKVNRPRSFKITFILHNERFELIMNGHSIHSLRKLIKLIYKGSKYIIIKEIRNK
jgi:hypothetical protein